MLEITCRKCGKTLSVDNFYFNAGKNVYYKKCKACILKDAREGHRDYKKDGIGVRMFPGEYSCEEQRKMTFEFLTALGWRYSKTKGIWYKSGLKSKYGKWYNLKSEKKSKVKIEKKVLPKLPPLKALALIKEKKKGELQKKKKRKITTGVYIITAGDISLRMPGI